MKNASTQVRVTVSKDGPYLVSGGIRLSEQIIGVDEEGSSERWIEGKTFPAQKTYALCRCGHSKTKPFCDGTHARIAFDGEETASRKPYARQARVLDGPAMQLQDAESLCAFARFCDPNGQVWNQVNTSDRPAVRALLIPQVGNCASGRLPLRPIEEQTLLRRHARGDQFSDK